MEFALTFGSVGDIIQLCLIAKQFYEAVGVGHDAVGQSATQYQELRQELDLLRQILFQVSKARVCNYITRPLLICC